MLIFITPFHYSYYYLELKVDEILGNTSQLMFTVKPDAGIVATSYKPGDKVFLLSEMSLLLLLLHHASQTDLPIFIRCFNVHLNRCTLEPINSYPCHVLLPRVRPRGEEVEGVEVAVVEEGEVEEGFVGEVMNNY